MKLRRFWYAVATEVEFHHVALAIVSATALRRVAPDAFIGIALDEPTLSLAGAESADLHSVFDEVLVMDAPEPSPMLRSRSLKLRLREKVRGDFVYLDTDILITDAQAWDWPKEDVSMALDAPLGEPGALPMRLAAQFQANGWNYPPRAYFNAGMILWRDTDGARSFAETWLSCWRHSAMNGIPLDQPALAHTNDIANTKVGVLSPSFNVPVFLSPSEVRSARVWHFWPYKNRASVTQQSILHVLQEEYLAKRTFNHAAFESALRSRYPWNASLGARFMLRNGYYRMAADAAITRVFRKRSFHPWLVAR